MSAATYSRWECPSCGSDRDPRDLVCSECGLDMHRRHRKCPHCKHEARGVPRRCTHCGTAAILDLGPQRTTEQIARDVIAASRAADDEQDIFAAIERHRKES